MTINIRAQEMELTDAIRSYVEEKFSMLEKYAHDLQLAEVVVGKSSQHHQKGDVYLCSATLTVHGEVLKMEREAEDLYKAIDKVKDHFREQLAERKARYVAERRAAGEEVVEEEVMVETEE